jgi:hypothetical protein
MTGVRRRGYFAAVVAVVGAALLTGLLAAPPDRPVDIRLVAPPPLPPETITAIATTAVPAVNPELRPPPPPPPTPPPPLGDKPPPRHKPPVPPPPPPKPLPPDLLDFLRCDQNYLGVIDLERCLDWPLDDTKAFCSFLKEAKLNPVDLRNLGFKDLDCH